MSLVDQIKDELKTAMKARDKERVGALRSIRAAIIEALKADGSEDLSEEQGQQILRRLAKQRRESIEAFEGAGRAEMAATEKSELAVIEAFLPQMADEAQTKTWVDEAIAATGASSMGDMGKVMGKLMSQHKAVLDAKLANQLVRKALQG